MDAGPHTSLFISPLDHNTTTAANQPKGSRDTSVRPKMARTPPNTVCSIPAEAHVGRVISDWTSPALPEIGGHYKLTRVGGYSECPYPYSVCGCISLTPKPPAELISYCITTALLTLCERCEEHLAAYADPFEETKNRRLQSLVFGVYTDFC